MTWKYQELNFKLLFSTRLSFSDFSMANWYMSKAPLGPSAPWPCPESHALPVGMDIENSPMFNIPLKGIVGAFLLIYLN